MQIALERNVPHVARNVWLSGFQMFVLFEVVINDPTFPLSHTLLFMLMTKQKPKFFRLGCIFFDFRFETIIVLAFTVEVMEEDNLFTRFVTVAI